MTAKQPAEQHQLSQLAARLGERDWSMLDTIRAFRYLTTRQVARQHFGAEGADCSIPRNANAALDRLRELGLLVNLQRRIGGVRAGSGGHVWQITDTAQRLLAAKYDQPRGARVRAFEPGTTFLEHTLAVAEVVISLQEAGTSAQLSQFALEPDAWRSYLAYGGATKTLKPDLAATTSSGKYEDVWFFEIDLDTEPPSRIITKSLQYQEYRTTGREQDALGIFPAVVWVVPNKRRNDQLRERLAADTRIDNRLFIVITPDQIGELLALGAETFNKRTGGQKEEHPHEK